MRARYLLDTKTFSYIVKGSSRAARAEFRRLVQDPNAEVCISVMTEAEIRYGMAKFALSPQRASAIEGLLAQVEILPWGSEEAAVYGRARVSLPKGLTVEAMDFLIAVQSAACGAVLVTHDNIFSRIADIVGIHAVVDWATDLG